jgi:hypothetical protein
MRLALLCSSLFLTMARIFASGQEPAKPEAQPPEFPVRLDVEAGKRDDAGKQRIVTTLTIQEGYGLFANPVGNPMFMSYATTLTVTGNLQPDAVKITYPQGQLVEDEITGDYYIYRGVVKLEVEVSRGTANQGPITVNVRVQPWNDHRCFLPRKLSQEVP